MVYSCQGLAACELKEVTQYFNLSNVGSAHFITCQIRKRKQEDIDLLWKIEGVIANIGNQETYPRVPFKYDTA